MHAATVSADVPDWSREAVGLFEFAPGRKLLKSVRDWQRAKAIPGLSGKVRAWAASKRHAFWTVLSGAEIPLTTCIGGGVLIPHPNGIVIHPDSIIGPNCLIFQQVTLGTNNSAPPRLDGHVDVGAGAKILGNVTVGRHARVGANAVVISDVPAGATVVGIPARPL
jgi:serine O-acetyltransferase